MKLSISLSLFITFLLVSIMYLETSAGNSKENPQAVNHACKLLKSAVEKGDINLVKKLIREMRVRESQLVCIKYAIKQTLPTGERKQFQSFRYLVEGLLSMNLLDEQIILNKLLQDYAIVYLSNDPWYTEYLLGVGALPKMPNKSGQFPVVSALWAVNDYGDCDTPRLLINASNPEMLVLQNKNGETPLMQSIGIGYLCPDELKLLAKKSAGLDIVDHKGNTSLHYLLLKIKRDMELGKEVNAIDLELLCILLKRGASIKIANKQSITPSQLLTDLQDKGYKCYEEKNLQLYKKQANK